MTATVVTVLAPNPGPMTLEGTNTYLVSEEPGGPAVVVDPGPLDEGHLAAVAARGPVTAIVLTHSHPDHAAGAGRLAELTGAPLRRGLGDGDVIAVSGVELRVLATPGHSADSVCFLLPQRGELFTGDTILGRGTSVVAHPDGRLADYLASLDRLARLPLSAIRPGHGPPVADPRGWVEFYRRHRAERLAQVRAALAQGATTPEEVLAAVYADLPTELRPAALLSVRAQLAYLRES